jgi:hypothetical protein
LNNTYYVYAYLRQDGTPYYIGKGIGQRAWKHVKQDITHPPKDTKRIILLKEQLSEVDAFNLEKQLIAQHGRIDTGTGILRNRTDGGDGTGGIIRSKTTCEHCNTLVDLQNYKRWHGDNCIGVRGPTSFPGSGRAPAKKCPHCDIECRPGVYSKYHGENCKKIALRKELPKIHCVHCNRFITNFNYPRYHGDMCKINPTSSRYVGDRVSQTV